MTDTNKNPEDATVDSSTTNPVQNGSTCFNRPIVGKKTDIQNPELWEFPMDYPMSIIGHEGEHDTLLNEIKLILGTQFPDFDLQSIQIKPSKTGRFHSLRVNLHLTDAEQVNQLYKALDDAKTVKMVL